MHKATMLPYFLTLICIDLVLGHATKELSLDLVVAFDSSRSIDFRGWTKQIDITQKILHRLKISSRDTHVGVLDFSNHTHQRIQLMQGKDEGSVLKKLDEMRRGYEGGDHTYTDRALADATDIFKQSPLSRRAPPVLIMLTDGKITGFGLNKGLSHINQMVSELKTMGVTIFCITFGNRIDMEGLHYIVGAHNEENIFSSDNFNTTFFINKLQNVFNQNEEIQAAPATGDTGLGSVCNINFVRLGCYYDHQIQPRPLPVVLMTDRDPKHENYSGRGVDWANWDEYIYDFVCRCAKKAKETNSVLFAAQFYGECYGSRTASGYAKDGPAKSGNACITTGKKPCSLNAKKDKVCVGRQFHNYVYLLLK